MPSVAKSYELSADGRTFTLSLRKGMRWSDGAPFTADDFVFWFEDIYGNKDITPTPIPDMTPAGKPGRMVKLDDHTVRFEFENPYYLFPSMIAGDTLIGGGGLRDTLEIFGSALADVITIDALNATTLRVSRTNGVAFVVTGTGFENLKLHNYQSYGKIAAPVAV